MKRILTFALMLVMIASLLVPCQAFADTEINYGGMDFYSITINYDRDVLVGYSYNSKKKTYLFDNGGESVMANKYVLRAGTVKTSDYIDFDKQSATAQQNFYQLISGDDKFSSNLVTYGNLPYDDAFITSITDKVVLKSKDMISLYGIIDPYDDSEAYTSKNPNLSYDNDGYCLDENGKRIDINGFVIDENGLWYDESGRRVELFYSVVKLVCKGYTTTSKGVKKAILDYEVTEDLEVLPYELRFDENGKIKDLKDIDITWFISTDEYNQFGADNMETATDANPAYLTLKVATDEDLETINKSKTKYKKETVGVSLCPIDKTKVSSGYDSVETKFTMDQIERDAKGRIKYSTPKVGNPKVNVKITSITIELDAIGNQGNNSVTISLNDFIENCNLKSQALKDGFLSQSDFDEMASYVLSTVKSEATKTEITAATRDVKATDNKNSTVKSFDLGLSQDQLNNLPRFASFYLTFSIDSIQSAGYEDEVYGKNAATSNISYYVAPTTKANNGTAASSFPLVPVLIGAGAVVVIAAVVVIIIIASKKKKAA